MNHSVPPLDITPSLPPAAEGAGHSPAPWQVFSQPEQGRIRIGRSVSTESAEFVATLFDGSRKEANALHIVRCVNERAQLVEAVKLALRNAESRLHMLPLDADSIQRLSLEKQISIYRSALNLSAPVR